MLFIKLDLQNHSQYAYDSTNRINTEVTVLKTVLIPPVNSVHVLRSYKDVCSKFVESNNSIRLRKQNKSQVNGVVNLYLISTTT